MGEMRPALVSKSLTIMNPEDCLQFTDAHLQSQDMNHLICNSFYFEELQRLE